jgi:hypothetical protein
MFNQKTPAPAPQPSFDREDALTSLQKESHDCKTNTNRAQAWEVLKYRQTGQQSAQQASNQRFQSQTQPYAELTAPQFKLESSCSQKPFACTSQQAEMKALEARVIPIDAYLQLRKELDHQIQVSAHRQQYLQLKKGQPGAIKGHLDLYKYFPYTEILLEVIHKASHKERWEVLQDTKYLDSILGQMPENDRLAVCGALMEASMKYKSPSDSTAHTSTFHHHYIMQNQDGQLPNSINASMNCWEFLMYAQLKAGNTKLDKIRSIYKKASWDSQKIFEALGYTRDLPQYNNGDLQIGTIVFNSVYDRQSYSHKIVHVAISLGGKDIVSMHEIGSSPSQNVRRIKITDIFNDPFQYPGCRIQYLSPKDKSDLFLNQ